MLEALLRATPSRGRRHLFACAEGAGDVLPRGLRAAGAEVDVVPLYATVEAPVDEAWLRGELRGGRLDVVTLASPSAVRALVARLGGDVPRALGSARLAAIGPSTAAALEAEGLRADAVAEEPSDAGLARAAVSSLASKEPGGRR